MEFVRNEMAYPAAGEAAEEDDDDRRIYVRFAFRGSAFPMRIGDVDSTLRLKDLSCGGASALSDMPLTVGDVVYVQLDGRHEVAAEVRWVRRLWVGLKFVKALAPSLVRKVHADRSPPEPPFPAVVAKAVKAARSRGSARR